MVGILYDFVIDVFSSSFTLCWSPQPGLFLPVSSPLISES